MGFMARPTEVVKIIDHTTGGSPFKQLAGAAIFGLVAGAGSVATVVRSRSGQSSVPGAAADQNGSDQKPNTRPPTDAFDLEAVGIDEPDEKKGIKAKILRFAQRHNLRFVGRTLQVQRRYSEIQGNNVASAVTLQVFVALFPLFLVAAAVLGFVVHANGTEVVDRIVNGMGLKGAAADAMRETLTTATQSRKASSILGLLALVWSALGVSSALQYAYNQAWQTGGRGIKDKAVGAAWLAGAALLFVATAAVTTAAGWIPRVLDNSSGWLAFGLSTLGIVIGAAVGAALWMFTAKVLPNVEVSWKALIPGTILGVIGLEILKLLGGVWLPKAVESSSAVYGAIGVVFAILAWMLIFGKLVVYSAVLNVVMYEAKHGAQEATIELPKPAAAQKEGVTRSGQADTA